LEGVPLGLIPNSNMMRRLSTWNQETSLFRFPMAFWNQRITRREEFGPDRLKGILSAISQGESAREITEQIMAATDGHSGAGIAPPTTAPWSAPCGGRTFLRLLKLPIIY